MLLEFDVVLRLLGDFVVLFQLGVWLWVCSVNGRGEQREAAGA